MAKIYNSDVTKGLAKNAGIQQNVDKVPNELAEKIVPTFETNPAMLRRCNVVVHGTKTTTGSINVYTTSTIKKFYLTHLHLSYQCNAANDGTGTEVSIVVGGVTRFFHFKKETLKAYNDTFDIPFTYPIELDKGTAIAINNTFTAGTATTTLTICGFEVQPTE